MGPLRLPASVLSLGALAALGAAIAGCDRPEHPAPDAAVSATPPQEPATDAAPGTATGDAPAQVDASGAGRGTGGGTGEAGEGKKGDGEMAVADAPLPEIPWIRDHDQAFAEARKTGKPILIDFW